MSYSNKLTKRPDIARYANTLTCTIEYDIDQTLDIKEEIIMDEEIVSFPKYRKQYESNFSTAEIRQDDILVSSDLQSLKTHTIQESQLESRYKCEKCARSYTRKENLNYHKKFQCDVIPQFRCEFCGKKFKHKLSMNRHIDNLHLKTDIRSSQWKHHCDQCFQSYKLANSLYKHKRLKHAEVEPPYICNSCGFKTKEKHNLSSHIISSHLK
ncbi:zinc finger protein 714-like [Belonocnema kinseyi]|uniref:zinc finger protein 714-like n=1 Tax=Belonocnema kinseyi TaxID=2817044 RepID=UPI00143D8CBB|nr:zinc finger protein 714-like [Belonocnema kinseyi]